MGCCRESAPTSRTATTPMPDDLASGPIVVGFEGGPSSEDALALSSRLARGLGARQLVVTVYPAPAPISPGRVDAEWVADRRRTAEEVLAGARDVLESAPAPGDVDYLVLGSSSAAHGLHDIAESESAEMIVVGSYGEGPSRRLFPGSTADRLLSGATCPVAVAPRGLRKHPERELRRIGVAYVDTADGRAALTAAARLAVRTKGTLTLYTAVPSRAEVPALLLAKDSDEAFVDRAEDTFEGALDEAMAGLPVEVSASAQLLPGSPVDVLAELDEDDVDLLVCGSRGYGPVRHVLLGGVSARLVRRAASPVLVVPRSE
jgi:nucleotide-binding universal stress UspA family protein